MKQRVQQEKKIPPVPLIMYYGLLGAILLYMGISWLIGAPAAPATANTQALPTEASNPPADPAVGFNEVR